mmetsp:Transcript_72093/g.125084  ORF Transcript_72093/g.125084 Transcript_72093/m.125084 type:complete len:556 (-) Transcript_72093:51-1718(-)
MTGIVCFSALANLIALTIVSGSSSFLKTRVADSEARISLQEVQTSLLEEIEGSLGSGSAAKKLSQLEAQLRPMYQALPKNAQGGLSHSVVRYALHRLFVQRHGWVVKGLDPAGGSFNSSSPAGILKDQVPAFIQDLFEKRLHGKGMGLHELAVFAATIEHLIHNEAVGRLGLSLNVHEILPTSTMSEVEADGVLDTYMMAYILGENLTNMTLDYVKDSLAEMPELYLAWNETQEFMRGMRANTTAATQSHEINFATLAKVAEAAGEHFGSFQDKECRELKSKLVEMEDRGSGRVRLADFYKPALGGSWQFQESVSYLKQLGALDESDPKDTRVIIPNYLMSQSNCIASSSFYSVCCMDECEALMGHLEAEIAGPEAPADRIASLISKLPSSSVNAPWTLSSTQVQRLNDIAASHGGTVPMHGRLFAQWMHHAYPRECPYPHESGTTNPQTEAEWVDNGNEATATEAEMLEYCSPSQEDGPGATADLGDVEMPWSHAEELLIGRTSPALKPAPSSWGTFRNFMLFSLMSSVMISLVRMMKSVQPSSNLDSPQKLLV